MREPWFWRVTDRKSRASAPALRLALTPLAAVYSAAGARRLRRATPFVAAAPVICVGNLTLGGTGKTPVAAAIRARLAASGRRAATLSRGHGGRLEGPIRVDPAQHASADVGDEPLMLAAAGESWVARDRAAGARAMTAAGVDAIVMDDGHQNPTLAKALSLVVIDAAEPFGNGFIFPKGPLREPVARGLARADAAILMGEGPAPAPLAVAGLPVLRARLAPLAAPPPGRYVAFAGIGKPERFFDLLARHPGVELADAVPYADHHRFTASDLGYLAKLARDRGARLITTAKDHVRLPAALRADVATLPVEARFEDEEALGRLLASAVEAAA